MRIRPFLFTGAVAAGIYAVVAILGRYWKPFHRGIAWVPAVIYVGPAAYFIGIATMNRSAFQNIQSTALRRAALVTRAA